MDLGTFYKAVVACGIEQDPRKDKSRIKEFSDSAILFGSPRTPVRRIMVGIDIEVPELLLADRLRERAGLDLVLAHHPEGRPFARLAGVMQVQVDVLRKAGVPADTAQQLMDDRIREVARKLLPANHTRATDAARLLALPFMCAHTPADNHVYGFISARLNRRKPRIVRDIISVLMELEEYRNAAALGNQPRVIFGNANAAAGKILVDMTGGTEGHVEVFDKLYKAGVRTLVCMHVSEEHFRAVRDTALTIVIAGHVSSDTLGVNLLLDNVERRTRQEFDVIDVSGFKRIRRKA